VLWESDSYRSLQNTITRGDHFRGLIGNGDIGLESIRTSEERYDEGGHCVAGVRVI
jgi:hypothetical protein